jgi:LPS-assembly protein
VNSHTLQFRACLLAGLLLTTLTSTGIHAATALVWDCKSASEGKWDCSGVEGEEPAVPVVKPATRIVEPVAVPEEAATPATPETTTAAPEAAEPVAEPPEVTKAAPPAPVEEAAPVTAKPAAEQPEVIKAAPPAPVEEAAPVTAKPVAEQPEVIKAEPVMEPAPLAGRPQAEPESGEARAPRTGKLTPEQAEYELCATAVPVRPDKKTLVDPRTAPIKLTADQVELVREGISTFTGNVEISRSYQKIEADKVVYDKPANTVEATGNVTFQDLDTTIKGASAKVDLETDQGEYVDTEYRLHYKHARGTADTIRREQPAVLNLENITYTTCDAGNQDWVLSSEKLDLDTDKKVGVARNATLRFKGVPILYTPYISFPLSNERKSGMLTPSVGVSDESGFEIEIPYYWNIAPNMDATITPHYYEKRGMQLQGEFRYLRPDSEGMVRAEYLPSDNDYGDEDRQAFSWLHEHRLSPRWNANVDFNYVSDENYFEDLGTSLDHTSRSYLPKRLDVTFDGDIWNFAGRIAGYQTIDQSIPSMFNPYDRLPQLVVQVETPEPVMGLTFGVRGEFAYFDRNDTVTGARTDIRPYVSLPMRRPWGYITPKASLYYTRYDLNDQFPGEDDTPTRTVPIFSLDSGLYVDRDTSLFGRNYTHTLEPRLYYLYAKYVDQDRLIVDETNTPVVFDTQMYDFNFEQLFRENRFSGGDRVGDANQVTVALTSRLLDKESGIERLRASIGQIFHFRDREVTMPGYTTVESSVSNIVGELFMQLDNSWSFTGGMQWDHDESETDKGIARFSYQPDSKHILNLAYRYQRDLLEQTDVSFRWNVNRNLYAVGRWNYAIKGQRTLEGFAGVEYDSCCWTFRIMGRQWVNDLNADQDNTAIYLQLELKGLIGLGQKVDKRLEKGILGYGLEDRFQDFIDE